MSGVALTGLGLLGPWGADRAGFDAALAAGRPPHGPTKLPEFDLFEYIQNKDKRTKKMDPLSRAATVAAVLAVRAAALDPATVAPGRGAVVSGSCFGALDAIELFRRQLEEAGPDAVDPTGFPPTSHNVPGGHLSIQFGFSGPLVHLASGELSGEQAVLFARDLLGAGRADVALAGGWDTVGPHTLATLEASAQPGGPAPVDAAAVAVLETEAHARARGARPQAWLQGGATWAGAPGDPSVLVEAARTALGGDEAVDLLVAGSAAAAEALSRLLGRCRPQVVVLPDVLGATFGATGPLALAVLCARRAQRSLVASLTAEGEATALVVAAG